MCGGGLIAPNWFVTAGHCEMTVGEYVDYHRFDMLALEPQAERHQVKTFTHKLSVRLLDCRACGLSKV